MITSSSRAREPSEPLPYEPQPWVADLTKLLAAKLFTTGWLDVRHIEQCVLESSQPGWGSPSAQTERDRMRSSWCATFIRSWSNASRTERSASRSRARAAAPIWVVEHGKRLRVFEFSVLSVGVAKGHQLMRYARDLRSLAQGRAIIPHLVAMSYEGDSTSREINVDGQRALFANWHDFLRDLLRGPSVRGSG